MAEVRAPVLRSIEGQRGEEMELHVRRRTKVHIQSGGSAGPAVGSAELLGGEGDLPLMQLHRLRVIGDERRTPEGGMAVTRSPRKAAKRKGVGALVGADMDGRQCATLT